MLLIRSLLAPIRLIVIFALLILLMAALVGIYLCVSSTERRKEWMHQSKAYICQRLLQVLNIRVNYVGQSDPDARLWVANHISWLDVLTFTSIKNLHFIAKSEVRTWPIVGFITSLLGTVFIRRDNKFQVYRSLPRAQAIIQQSENLFVFPEGTTSRGQKTENFYTMMFEIAVREKTRVQPIAIRYWNSNNQPCTCAPFVGDDGIIGNILKLARKKSTLIEVHYLASFDAQKMDRKQLAYASQNGINRILCAQFPNLYCHQTRIHPARRDPASRYELE